jgi:hypothetical protein
MVRAADNLCRRLLRTLARTVSPSHVGGPLQTMRRTFNLSKVDMTDDDADAGAVRLPYS